MSLALASVDEIYRHKNGLRHINIVDRVGFSALFVVNTPIFDNSGVAHGVEHGVFRRSLAFPNPESLFQLSALTDVKINASTFANTTYYHCQSQCSDTFLLAIDYLLHGLFSPFFYADDLRFEIHDGNDRGVIYRELLGIEQEHNKRVKPHQADAFCYGGISSTIGALSINDLKDFHQRFYQANNITLVTANADIEKISNLISLLPMSPKENGSVKPNNKLSQSKSELNKYHESAAKKDLMVPSKAKYSLAISALIDVYHASLQSSHYLEVDNSITISQANKTLENDIRILIDAPEGRLITPLLALSNKLVTETLNEQAASRATGEYPSETLLPQLFSKLFKQAKAQLSGHGLLSCKNNIHDIPAKEIYQQTVHVTVTDKSNVLWLASIAESEQEVANISSYIISAAPIFLARRCQGFCYTTQALAIENSAYLAIYSAFDVNPVNWVEELSSCLLMLSEDSHFIRMSLALAKVKYCRSNKVTNNEVLHITAETISSYLQSLAKQ
ncbi:hypothetical protein [uncultured Paraglaciecola sp.]|uniref:hypothetical protein n=1 Tax=uncultured Paraglaciecola sp. TaxID=1765024 RepID=UPI0030D8AE62|tara:strand:+ start:182 stop:1693 length:1512 start_codon:yes stop_codon:yes gene_type:complete